MTPQSHSGMMLLLASLAVLAVVAVGSDNTMSDPETPYDSEYETRSYLILYKDAVNSQDAINCTLPLNFTRTTNDVIYQRWVAPSGVPLVPGAPEMRTDGRGKHNKAWVELTPDNTLVFHNPDSSVSGPYVCHSEANQQTIHQTKIWVHVMKKSRFNTSERLQVAFVAAAIFLVIVLLCIGGFWWLRRRRLQYHVTKSDDDNFDIQTMPSLVSSGSKV